MVDEVEVETESSEVQPESTIKVDTEEAIGTLAAAVTSLVERVDALEGQLGVILAALELIARASTTAAAVALKTEGSA
jgi:hypothetical protein